jgi:hypothetical protein
MERLASLLPKPLRELAVDIGVGLADVVQTPRVEPCQLGSLAHPLPPAPEERAQPCEATAPGLPPRGWPMQRHLRICHELACEIGHDGLFE